MAMRSFCLRTAVYICIIFTSFAVVLFLLQGRTRVRSVYVTEAPTRVPRDLTLPLVSTAILRTAGGHELKETYEPNDEGVCTGPSWSRGVPPVYVITPTYPRAVQIPELTRLGQALRLVDNLVWIVVDDTKFLTPAVLQYFDEHPICHVYLQAQMPSEFRSMPKHRQPRGVANRLKALEWLRMNAKRGGAFYFGDDDNTYDVRIFDEIRQTKKVSMFPVGLIGKLGVSSPIVRDGKVTGFYDGFIGSRKFAVDMAGFAVNVQFFLSKRSATMPFQQGKEETKFLESLDITLEDIEVLADKATKILVWHTKTIQRPKSEPGNKRLQYHNSNIDSLNKQI